jgi:hypothetical protein
MQLTKELEELISKHFKKMAEEEDKIIEQRKSVFLERLRKTLKQKGIIS